MITTNNELKRESNDLREMLKASVKGSNLETSDSPPKRLQDRRTMAFRSLDEPLPHCNHVVCLDRFPLYRTYRDLESVCNYYRLTADHKYKFPFAKVLSLAVN